MDSEANEPIEEPVETFEEPAEQPAEKKSAPKVTSTVKKTKPMTNPERVAAGKRLAQHNRKVKEVKANRQKGADMDSKVENENDASSFSLTQVLSAVSIVVSLAGLYYKREELMSLVKHKKIERERDGASAASATASESQLEVPARSERNEDLTSSKIKNMD